MNKLLLPALLLLVSVARADGPGITFEGGDGPGKGKRVVLVSGDEEYRSEEALPMLAKLLATRHGFTCTVLFALGTDGTIDPNKTDNIPGLEALDNADLLILFTRMRNLPDDQMRHIVQYVESGRPIIGMRTSTHAFKGGKGSPFAKYAFDNKDWDGGFGRQVLGETWISHHGDHGKQSTRGIVAPGEEGHPILKGIQSGDIWGPTDVYGVRLPLPGDSRPLILGEVVGDMSPTGKPLVGRKNDPMMPVAWIKTYEISPGKAARIFNTTMGAATDLESASLRRLLVNATYWAVGLEDKITPTSNVEVVGDYKPTNFGFGGHVKGKKPADYAGN